MKTSRLLRFAIVIPIVFGSFTLDSPAQGPGHGQGKGGGMGMPEAERANIHGLFEAHGKIVRKVKVTENGYVSTTTSEDPKIAKILKNHVEQMQKRLDSGLRVRRWDPAFDEYVAHYKDIEITIKPIKKGIRVTAIGKTDDAIKVARNHAEVISAFVENGWDEAHAEHLSALGAEPEAEKTATAEEERP